MQPGDRIGAYQLVARLGVGGMGEVWEANLHGPKGFKRSVALKVLRPSHELDGVSRRGLLHEARLGALLSHPNVVAIHEAGEIDGRVFVAMELVHGVPVSRLIAQAGLPPAALRSVGEQAARGLHHCHSFEVDGEPVGLVHRDIKPRNLLVDRYGTVRVADLGIARLVGSGADVAGTVGYMPPEQARGTEDARADLYALGVSLYVLATMSLPFGPSLLDELELAHRLSDPSLLAPAEAAVPGLGRILARCLAPNPADRYATALDLAEALSRLGMAGEGLASVVGRVLGGDLDTPSPPPRRDGHLPSPDDRFVGRDAERAAIVARLEGQDRLFTLIGPGGAGKTRFALEIAREVAPRFPGGAWFCDLSGATSADELCAVVARTLQVPLGERDPVAQVGLAIRGRGRVLLVLDNMEQLVRSAADAVTRWAHAAPEATLLLTSRTALRVSEERLLALGPLEEADGVALFRERAVPLTVPDAAIADLVRQLDGLPLAIELAAARTRTMTVEEIVAHLDERFRIVAGGGRSRPERHRSLRASLDSSWALLAPWEQQALAQLAVFVDGFTLEAAAAVVDLRAWPAAPPIVAVLGSAYDQSLLRVDPDGRFRMLLTIRDYAAQTRRPAERAADEGRHVAYFAQLGSPDALAAVDLRGGEERRRRLGADVEDLIAAVRRAVARGDGAGAAGAALAAWTVIHERGPIAVGLEVLELALTLGPSRSRELRTERAVALALLHRNDEAREALDALLTETADRRDPLRIHALLRRAHVDQIANRAEAARAGLTEALALALSLGDRRCQGEARTGLGGQLHREGRAAEAAETLREALALQVETGDRRAEANTRVLLALVLRDLDRRAEARAELEEALEIARRTGTVSAEARALGNLGMLAHERSELDEAERLYLAALQVHREVGHARSEAITLGNLGTLHRLRGRHDDAVRALEASIAGHAEGGDRLFQGHAVANLGNVLRDAGRPREALRRYDAAIWLYRSVGAVWQELRAVRFSAATCQLLGQDRDEVARLLRAIALADGADLRVDAARCRAELLQARIAAGDRETARAELPLAEAIAEGDPYSEAVVGYARAVLAPAGDPAALDELARAIRILEGLGDVVQLAACLIALARRVEGADAAAALTRAAGLVQDLPVPEAVIVLRLQAEREPDPERATSLRAAADLKAAAMGVPVGVGLRA